MVCCRPGGREAGLARSSGLAQVAGRVAGDGVTLESLLCNGSRPPCLSAWPKGPGLKGMAADPLEEIAFSVRRLRVGPTGGHGVRPGLGQWCRRTRTGVAARAGILLDLVPREGFLPDFLVQPANDFDTGVALAAQTPTEQLAADIARLHVPTHTGHRLRELAEGTSGARQGLARGLRRYFSSCLADLWPQVGQAGAVADWAPRAGTLLRGGVDGLPATPGPGRRWEPPHHGRRACRHLPAFRQPAHHRPAQRRPDRHHPCRQLRPAHPQSSGRRPPARRHRQAPRTPRGRDGASGTQPSGSYRATGRRSEPSASSGRP